MDYPFDKALKKMRSKAVETIYRKLDTGDIKGALAELAVLEKARPIARDILHAKARVLGATGKAEEGLAMLFRLTEGLYPADIDVETLNVQIELGERTDSRLWSDYARSLLAIITKGKEPGSFDRESLLVAAQQAAIDDPTNPEALFHLAEVFLKTQHHVAAMVVLTLAAEYAKTPLHENRLYNSINARWSNLESVCALITKGHPIALVVCTEEDECCCAVLAELLVVSGRQVHLLAPPTAYDATNEPINLHDLTELTIKETEQNANLFLYRPYALVRSGEIQGVNVINVLDHIRQKLGFSLLICEDGFMEHYFASPLLKRDGQRFTPNFNVGVPTASAGYVGPYTTYIEHMLIGKDESKKITDMPIFQKSKVAISVVIPTRNSAFHLEHTLRTCINQQIDDYEIVVSDNSSPGNTETYELVKRLNSPKIRYVRPPRELLMTKNYEHGILHAEGDFIFTLGSDDGLLFHGLKYLKDALAKLLNYDVVMWKTATYNWPDCSYYGLRGMLNVPSIPSGKELNIKKVKSKEIMDILFKTVDSPNRTTYESPVLYTNSGFKKRYIHTLLQKTGRILDALAPDVYAGYVNLALCKEVPLMNIPIAIGGIASRSSGLKNIAGNNELENTFEEFTGSDVGHSIPSPLEEQMPITSLPSCFPGIFLRVVNMGLNPMMSAGLIKWKDAVMHSAVAILKTDVKFDLYLRQHRYGAYLRGEEFGKEFDKDVLSKIYVPHTETKTDKHPKGKYESNKGFQPDGGLLLDSEKFGVTNVYEAAELFDKIYNL